MHSVNRSIALLAICLFISIFLTACSQIQNHNTAAEQYGPPDFTFPASEHDATSHETQSAVTSEKHPATSGSSSALFSEPTEQKDTDIKPPAQEFSTGKDAYILIQVGDQSYRAAIHDNAATQAFLALLPLTVNMNELNGNEKYTYLPQSLPADAEQPGWIYTGDLMLYGTDCLVLFYESFSSSYSYTQIGTVETPSGLKEALGSRDITVTFSLE